MFQTKTILVVLALACAACGSTGTDGSGGDDEQTFAVACVNDEASHDFGTSDPKVLGTVTAFPTGGASCTKYEAVPVTFVGSVGYAQCACIAGSGPDPVYGAAQVVFIVP